MATTAQNNVVLKGRVLGYNILTDGTADINQGDQLYLDTSAHVAKVLGSSDDTNAAHFIGVALDSSYISTLRHKRILGTNRGRNRRRVYVQQPPGDTIAKAMSLYVGVDCQTYVQALRRQPTEKLVL